MTGLPAEIKQIATTVAVPYHEPPAVVIRRRIVVAVVLVIGAAVLGFTLTRRPGEPSFIWLTFLLAAVWTVGAFASGPLHLGSIRWRGRNQRPVITRDGDRAAAGRRIRGRGVPRHAKSAR